MSVPAKQLNIDWHDAVVVATTVPGVLATDFEAGDTINGVVLALNDRILIKNQVDPVENGLYSVTTGAPTRSQDAVTGRLRSGASVFVSEGTVGAATAWWLVTVNPIVPGVTAQVWTQFGGPNPNAPVLQEVTIRGVDNTGTNFHGTIDTSVARFNGAVTQIGAVPLADWVTVTDSATLGTVVSILQRGLYMALLYVPLTGGSTFQCGVTFNAPVGIRQGNFEPYDASVYASGFVFGSLLEIAPGGWPTLPIPITEADILAGTNLIRGQYTDVAGNPPLGGAFIDPANVVLRISRFGDLPT